MFTPDFASNRPFPSCFELQYESEAKCKTFHMKISLFAYGKESNFRNKDLVRPSSYVAFQSNIMQTKLIKEIKFVGKATYESVRGIKFV